MARSIHVLAVAAGIALGCAPAVHAQQTSVQLSQEVDKLKADTLAMRQQMALDHDLLFKLRQHIALTDYQQTPYTESAWQYAPPPKGWKPPVYPAPSPTQPGGR